MGEQKHIIKRQIIELKVQGTAEEAQQLQAEVSRVYRQRIVPLMDKVCTELSQPDRIHRIESLEVDLGPINPQRMEEDLVARFSQVLPQALAEQIKAQEQAAGRQGQSSKVRSQLELLAFFARTGGLPWWADATQPQLLNDCLQYLVEAAPEQLRRLMRKLVREQRALQRLVSHYDDGLLSRLSGLLTPLLQSSKPQDLLWILQKARAGVGRPPAQLRRSVWTHILSVVGLTGETFPVVETFYRAVLSRVAVELGATYGSLISDVHHLLPTIGANISIEFKDTLETLYQEYMGAEPSNPEAMAQRLAQLPAAGEGLTDLWAALRTLVPRLPAPLQGELLAALRALEGEVASGAEASPAALQHSLELLQLGLAQQSLPPTVSRDLLVELRKLAANGMAAVEVSKLIQMLRQAMDREIPSPTLVDRSLVDLSFSDAEELYLDNAGLVILWPFLGHFFGRLGLLEEKQFKDAAARQRAVGLLQYVALGEASFPEYLLPLNKVLCGMELAEVFDFDPPLSESEIEECTNLLTAMIAQAPILRDMSPLGFRGTFLLRQGVLSTRDGAWLLRVERETYDIVLDRFPWGWEWVKLPWMAAPLRVEW